MLRTQRSWIRSSNGPIISKEFFILFPSSMYAPYFIRLFIRIVMLPFDTSWLILHTSLLDSYLILGCLHRLNDLQLLLIDSMKLLTINLLLLFIYISKTFQKTEEPWLFSHEQISIIGLSVISYWHKVKLWWKLGESKRESNGRNYDTGNFQCKENNRTPTVVSRMIAM